jgi:hypothetical protein
MRDGFLIVVFLVLGYLISAPLVWRSTSDMRRASRRAWAGTGHSRTQYLRQLHVAYWLGGWPGGVMALTWLVGDLRAQVHEEQRWVEYEDAPTGGPVIDLPREERRQARRPDPTRSASDDPVPDPRPRRDGLHRHESRRHVG